MINVINGISMAMIRVPVIYGILVVNIISILCPAVTTGGGVLSKRIPIVIVPHDIDIGNNIYQHNRDDISFLAKVLHIGTIASMKAKANINCK